MKHFKQQSASLLTLLALALPALPTQAAASDTREVQWTDVCRAAGNKEMTITTETGEPVVGYCVAIDAKGISVKTKDQKVVAIARNTLKKLEVEQDGSQLKALHKDMQRGLRFGVKKLFSPEALVGIVVVPAVLAWGAVSLPFCALGDLGTQGQGKREIKPL